MNERSEPTATDPVASTALCVDFGDLPLGTRFRYPGGSQVWTIIDRRREKEGGAMHGTVAQWEPDMLTYGKWPGQSFCSHIPESEGGDCPEKVHPID